MGVKRLLAIASAATVVSAAAPAFGYCRTTTCGPGECSPDPGCQYCLVGGLPLFWKGGCLSYSMHELGSPLRAIDAASMNTAITEAFSAWISVDCGGGQHPGLDIFDVGASSCGQPTFESSGPNANVWMFRDDTWPYASSQLALTTVTFSVDSGQIFDADVEINSVDNVLSLTESATQYDLKSIIVHEAGHFVGLAHSCVDGATMDPNFALGDSSLRTLEIDDATAICTVYPPGSADPACDPAPYNGFTPLCSGPGGTSGSGGVAGTGGGGVGGGSAGAGTGGVGGDSGSTASGGSGAQTAQPASTRSRGCSCGVPGSSRTGTAPIAALLTGLLAAFARLRRRR